MKATLKAILGLSLSLLLMGSSAWAQSDVTLRMTWWGSQNRHERTIRAIEMFEAQHPNINIEYEFSGWDDYWTRLNTQAAGGRLACIIQHDYAFLGEWQSRNMLRPLDPYLASGVIDTSNIPDSNLAGGRIGDELFALSLGVNSETFMLDLDLLEQADMELPATDWTWADFEAFALELHERLGIWAIGDNLANDQLWKSLFLGQGSYAFNEAGTALGYDDDQPLIDYFNMIMRLQDAGAVPTQEESIYATLGVESAPLVTQGAAMEYLWSNQVVALWSAAGADRRFALLPLPRSEGGQPQNYVKPSMFFSITSSCPNPDEAAMFMDFFTNNLEVNELLLAERGVPIATTVADHLTPLLGSAQQEIFAFLTQIADNASPVPAPDPRGWGDIRNNVYIPLFVQPVLYRQLPVERGVVLLREEANDILMRNR